MTAERAKKLAAQRKPEYTGQLVCLVKSAANLHGKDKVNKVFFFKGGVDQQIDPKKLGDPKDMPHLQPKPSNNPKGIVFCFEFFKIFIYFQFVNRW